MKKITTFLAMFFVALTSVKIALAQDSSSVDNKYTIEKNHTSVITSCKEMLTNTIMGYDLVLWL